MRGEEGAGTRASPFIRGGMDLNDAVNPEQKTNMTEDLLGCVSGSDKPLTTGSAMDMVKNWWSN